MTQQHEKISENKTAVTAAYNGGGINAVQLKNNREYSVVQRKFAEKTITQQASFIPVQRKANNTGLPNNLKSGIENLSGHSMDDVKVHYNSDKPAQLNAHAYAQGTDIHLASGQEKHLPHEAWHVVQQKQGRVKPTVQMKGKVNVNDDSGLEKEADVMGAKALQMKSESEGINSGYKKTNTTTPTVQRKVLINGVEKESRESGFDLFDYDHPYWLSDNYIRNYLSEEEFEAHDSGKPVKCGLLETLGLWYRLPFPSAVAGGPATAFFLLGENHGYNPIASILKASNQQNAKVLVESSAAFRPTQMGVGAGDAANLSTLPENANRHHIELGLSKALHAFAYLRAPLPFNQKTKTLPAFANYEVAGGTDVVGVHRMLPKADQDAVTFDAWKTEANGKAKFRNGNGILYFLRDTASGPRGIERPKGPGANNYNQGGAMETFIARPEIPLLLPENVRDAYREVVESDKDDRSTELYRQRYTAAYNALRQASTNNINIVYPGKTILERAASVNLPLGAAAGHAEIGMQDRNTVMLAGLRRAIAEGGYVAASLGFAHVHDIAAWENANHRLNILIITYGEFIKDFSHEAE
ncbi:uncharacterized protein DUF4157 [Flavobacterium sp. 90]|uniref:eCIS core domain-containing protein n=1 Tax=unclassified Flavobacterium TaxID=196869 RepID=UPI000EACD2D8|nr:MULTISPECIES: DUF4157 domain-containing protein [unclassified Flavobacterium]RKR04857.1 uncharacterized protein DUF4157 [Flavobacterium sp. 81]TCK56178.1 uncharacterized protein DUF4157 [Flavobacterium sp. 90]